MKVRLCRTENDVVIDLGLVTHYEIDPKRGWLNIYYTGGYTFFVDKSLAEQYLKILDIYFGTVDITDPKVLKQ